MSRKLLNPFIGIILLSSFLSVTAITPISVKPSDGGFIQGNVTEDFNQTIVQTIVASDCFLFLHNGTTYESRIISGVAGKTSCRGIFDITSFFEGILPFYFVIDGVTLPSSTTNYSTTIDRTLPTATVNAVHDSISDDTIDFDGTCTDTYLDTCIVQYDDGSGNTTLMTLNGTTTSLSTGNYTFWTVASDLAGNEFAIASPILEVVVPDAPQSPVVSVTPGNCDTSSRTCNTSQISTFTIDYSLTEVDPINLTILSGTTILKKYFDNLTFTHPYNFSGNGTYQFTYNGTNGYGYNETTYTIFVGNVSFNITINDVLSINYVLFPEKSSAVADGNDWVIIGFTVDMFGGDFIRWKMSDMVGPQTIFINEDVQPLAFCGTDYNSGLQDIVVSPTYNTYLNDNIYNESVVALNCPDTNPSSRTGYTGYIKILIPSGMSSGDYAFSLTPAMYSTVI